MPHHHRDAPSLAALAAPGPFFAVRTGRPPAAAVPLAAVYDGTAGALRHRLETVAGRLGTTEPRVAASLAHQGLASRLWSVALASAVLLGRLPDLAPDRLRWDPDGVLPDDLWLPGDPAPAGGAGDLGGSGGTGGTGGAAAAVWQAGYRDHLAPLAVAVRRLVPVSAALLRGNAASALAGAGRQLVRWARSTGAGRAAAVAEEITAALLARPELAAAGTRDGGGYRRRSCCLYYRTPAGGLCGDCVFTRAPGAPG